MTELVVLLAVVSGLALLVLLAAVARRYRR